ncbi:MAG: LysE family translocator [Burkholderiales bacterium]|jgi:threonine/homoserine/homoserine lactone efflux protein
MEIWTGCLFVIASVAFIALPGPNVLIIVSTGISQGKVRALQTVAGTSSAMAIQLTLVATGTTWIVQAISDGFIILKWAGVIWLVLLALYYFRRPSSSRDDEQDAGAAASYLTGFVASLTNPKTLLFFSAFLPQFVAPSGNYAFQITLLSLTFLMLAIIIDSAYALASAGVWRLLGRRSDSVPCHRLSALPYLLAATWLGMQRRLA